MPGWERRIGGRNPALIAISTRNLRESTRVAQAPQARLLAESGQVPPLGTERAFEPCSQLCWVACMQPHLIELLLLGGICLESLLPDRPCLTRPQGLKVIPAQLLKACLVALHIIPFWSRRRCRVGIATQGPDVQRPQQILLNHFPPVHLIAPLIVAAVHMNKPLSLFHIRPEGAAVCARQLGG